MQNTYLWRAALVVGFCTLASPVFAQERSHAPQAMERTGSTAHAQAETAADQALAERIRQGLQENAPLSGVAQNIHIIVSNGEVTLLGEVKTAEERDGVESQVRQIQGVQMVQNRLHLAGADRESGAWAPSAHD
jgi:osmotically-inducible protein OsmY